MASRLGSVLVVAMLLAAIPVGAAILISHSQDSAGSTASTPVSATSHYYTYSDLMKILSERGNTTGSNPSYGTAANLPAQSSGMSRSFSSSQSLSDEVTFSESGLPSNTTWTVTVNGKGYQTNETSQIVTLPSGTYSYSVSTVAGYISREPTGTFTLPGPGISIMTEFQSSLSVRSTLFLSNGTLVNGNYLGGSSSDAPIGIVNDPLNNYTYVADSSANVVDVIDSSGHVLDRIEVGTSPSQIVFNGVNGYLYVSNSGSNSISVINQNNEVVGTIDVGAFPFGMAFDPSTNYLYVANLFSNNITVLNPSMSGTASAVATITLPSSFNPFFSVYDKSTGSIYVSNVNGNQIAVIRGTTYASSVSVMGSPAMMAYDSSNGNLYVADAQSSASTGYGYLSVISSAGTVVANYTIPGAASPFSVSYDKSRNLLYVTDADSNQISVFNPQTNQFINRIQVGSEPYGISTDSANRLVEVSNFNSGTISYLGYLGPVKKITFSESGLSSGTPWTVRLGNYSITSQTRSVTFNETTGSYSYSPAGVVGYLLSSEPSTVSVTTSNITVNISYQKLFQLSVTETGLPSGTVWGFSLDGQDHTSPSRTINLQLVNGTYQLQPLGIPGYYSPSASQIKVSGGDVSANMDYKVAYSVTFLENGLLQGQNWSVVLNGVSHSSSTDSISLSLPNGTYGYTVSPLSGYTISVSSGTVNVQGSSVTASVSFVKLYSVTVVEHGISPGSLWNVKLGGTTGSSKSDSISFQISNGTYSYNVSAPAGYTPDYQTGTVLVSGGNLTVNLYFTREFQVAFIAEGLPSGQSWMIDVGGKVITAGSNEVGLNLTNGTYSYAASGINGYVLTGGNGQIKVDGSSQTVYITYEKLYSVTLTESGLPSGVTWYLNLTGQDSISSTTPSVTLNLTNGTYSYSIGTQDRIYRSPGGTFTVDGASISVQIDFSTVQYPVTLTETGLPSGTTWYVNLTNGQSYSSSSSKITAFLTNGSYSYTISTQNRVYHADGSSFTVAGGSVYEQVAFTPVRYSVTFTQSGLPDGPVWFINLSDGQSFSSASSQITMELTNGTYQYSISTTDKTYASTGGSLTISGTDTFLDVVFEPVTYSVVINESGLPAGTTWYLNITGMNSISSSGTTIQLNLSNGTYTYSAATVDKRSASTCGTIKVNGASVYIPVEFLAVKYAVTFSEKGLPTGTIWYLNLSNGDSYVFTMPYGSVSLTNGSYTYSISTADKTHAPEHGNGTLLVNGKSVSESVNFIPVYYSVKFSETGLPSGTTWYVNISGGMSYSSTTAVINIKLTNGSYSYSISTTDKTFSSHGGAIKINGTAVIVPVIFSPVNYTLKFVEKGLPGSSSWTVILNGSSNLATGDQMQFREINGTYAYSVYAGNGYSAAPSFGSTYVDGSNITVTIYFSENSTKLNFTESGVPDGHPWYLDFQGQVYSTEGKTITVYSHQGTNSYSANYTLYGINIVEYGNLTVRGVSENARVNFPALFSVTLSETGLDRGAYWGVNLSGSSIVSHGDSFTIWLPNGSYNFTIEDSSKQNFHVSINYGNGEDNGFTASAMVSGSDSHGDHGSNSLMVNGQNVDINVHFDHGSTGHHWGWGSIGSAVTAIVGYFIYIAHVIQYAATYVVVYVRLLITISVPALTCLMYQALK